MTTDKPDPEKEHVTILDATYALRLKLRSIQLQLGIPKDKESFDARIQETLLSHIGLQVRRGEAQRRVRSCLRRKNPGNASNWSPHCVVDEVAIELAKLAVKPMTPRQLLRALPISNRERVRWTKDGRLPTSGRVYIRRGQLISVVTYAPAVVEFLTASPEYLSEWRSHDKNG